MRIDSSRTLYRIVRSDPPTERDFWSHKRLGRRVAPNEEHIATGVSMYDLEREAHRTAARFPATGAYIAELRIPDRADVTIAQTLSRHHYTVRGDPALLVTFVVRVTPIRGASP